MKKAIVFFCYFFIASGLYSQDWPHPLIVDDNQNIIDQVVVMNESFYNDKYINGFSDLLVQYEGTTDSNIIQVYSNSLVRDTNKYLIYLLDAASGIVKYSTALIPNNNFYICNASKENGKLWLTGYRDNNYPTSLLQIIDVEIDLTDGTILSQSEPINTNILGNLSDRAYKTSTGYIIYSRTDDLSNTKIYNVSFDGDYSEVEIEYPEHPHGKYWNPVRSAQGYRQYFYNHRYKDGSHDNSDYDDARFYVSILDDDLNTVSRTDIFDMLPYYWNVDVVAENNNAFMIYCSDSLGTDDVPLRESLLLFNNDLELLDKIYLDSSKPVYDRSYSVSFDNAIIVTESYRTVYEYRTDIKVGSGTGSLELLETISYDDVRDVNVRRTYIYDDRFILNSEANFFIQDMNIFTLISR